MYLNLYPVIFEVFNIQVTYFGVVIGAVLALTYRLLKRDLKWSYLELTKDGLINIIISTVLGSIAGARIIFILLNLDFYFNPATPAIELIAIWNGGLSFWGGLLGGALTLFLTCEFKEISFSGFCDLLAPYILLSHGLGRIGNFIHGEAFGLPTQLPWGVIFRYGPAADRYFGLPIHPTMLYETVLCLIGFFLLYAIRKHSFRSGFMISLYLFLYSSIRFFLSFFRADEYKFMGYYATHFLTIIGLSLSLAIILGLKLFKEEKKGGEKQYKPTRQWNI